jgi:hypothetical protein
MSSWILQPLSEHLVPSEHLSCRLLQPEAHRDSRDRDWRRGACMAEQLDCHWQRVGAPTIVDVLFAADQHCEPARRGKGVMGGGGGSPLCCVVCSPLTLVGPPALSLPLFPPTFPSPFSKQVRDPRWGRGQETYGEDPFLTAALAGAYVFGLQGGQAALNGSGYLLAAATAKHFIAYQGATSAGTHSPTEVFLSWRDQIDTYEVAWRSVVAAGASAVMCAYSSLCHDDTNTSCSAPPPVGYGHSHGVPM